MDKKRFEKIYSQGTLQTMEVWVDRETGVQYLVRSSGYAGGMTVLVDGEGRPLKYPMYGSALSPERP